MQGLDATQVSHFEEVYARSNGKQMDNIEIADILFVTKLFSNLDDWVYPSTSPVYWALMGQIFKCIEFGRWTTDPSTLKMHISSLSKSELLRPQVSRKLELWNIDRNGMLQKYKLPCNDVGWSRLVLHWVRGPNGYRHMLQAARLLIDIKNFNVKGSK